MSKVHEEARESAPAKKTSNTGMTVGVIIVIIIAIIVATTSGGSKVDYGTYNGFGFIQVGQYWQTQVEFEGEVYDVPFYNHPLDVKPVLYDDRITTFLLDTPHQLLYIAVHPDAGSVPVLGGVNIARVTGKLYGLPTKSALYVEEKDLAALNTTEFPTVSCQNATQLTPVMHIQNNATITGSYFDDKNEYCIIVSATTDDEMLRIADIVAYKLLGIIPEE